MKAKDYLTVDPYCKDKQSPLYVSAREFYSGIYTYPEEEIIEDLHDITENPDVFLKLVIINGYASCGKTVFCHYIMHNFGIPDDFYYSVERSEGNRDIQFVKESLIKKFQHQLAVLSKTDKPVIDEFLRGGIYSNLSGVGGDLEKYFFGEGKNNLKNRLREYEVSGKEDCILRYGIDTVTKKGSQEKNAFATIEFILICDYFLRMVRETVNNTGNKTVFCLIDDIDCLSEKAVSILYVAVNEIITLLESDRRSYPDNYLRYAPLKFIILFPTRDVTKHKLEANYQKIFEEYKLKVRVSSACSNNLQAYRNLPDYIPAPSVIIQNRMNKSSEIRNNPVIKKMYRLLQIPAVSRTLTGLFNKNYDLYIELLEKLYDEQNVWMEDALNLTDNKTWLVADGVKGLILRVIFQVFDKETVFDEPAKEDIDGYDREKGRMGLSDLSAENVDSWKQRISLSRLLLTIAYAIPAEETSCIEAIEALDGAFKNDKDLIIRTLFALNEGQRRVWRRLILFSGMTPSSYKVYKKLVKDVLNGKCNTDLKYSLCLAGETYLSEVVPSFEFYAFRIAKNFRIEMPPLFSKKSLENERWKITIETMLEKLNLHAEDLWFFANQQIAAAKEKDNVKILKDIFIVSDAEGNRQTHLSRIVFSHITYISKFRKYLLFTKLEERRGARIEESTLLDKKEDKDLIEINKWLVSYIVQYLAIFDAKSFIEEIDRPWMKRLYLPESFHFDLFLKRTCSSILDEVKAAYSGGAAWKILEITTAYRKQETSAETMTNIIKEIIASDFTIIKTISTDEEFISSPSSKKTNRKNKGRETIEDPVKETEKKNAFDAPELQGINRKLCEWADTSGLLKKAIGSQISKSELKHLFGQNENKRYLSSAQLMRKIWKKNPVLGIMPAFDLLSQLEHEQKYYAKYRDHMTHMVKVFILGLYIYEKSSYVKKSFSELHIDEEEFVFTWSLTALWHDMGYLFETEEGTRNGEVAKIAFERITNALKYPLNHILSDVREDYLRENANIKLEIRNLIPLENEIDHLSIDAVVVKLSQKNTGAEAIKTYFKLMSSLKEGRMYYDHGIVSAALLLFMYNKLIEYCEKLQDSTMDDAYPEEKEQIAGFYEEVKKKNQSYQNAADAIALHNITKKMDSDCRRELYDSKVTIDNFCLPLKEYPYAYLLRVADELQTWDRQRFGNPTESQPVMDGSQMDLETIEGMVRICFEDNEIMEKVKSALEGIVKPSVDDVITLSVYRNNDD